MLAKYYYTEPMNDESYRAGWIAALHWASREIAEHATLRGNQRDCLFCAGMLKLEAEALELKIPDFLVKTRTSQPRIEKASP